MFPSTDLSATDIQTICFSRFVVLSLLGGRGFWKVVLLMGSSFPEKSNSDTVEDSAFHFKFRQTSPNVLYAETEDDPAHWYGYCLFRQLHDVSAKRNYRQKSLILISQHDFPPLFGHIVKTISLLGFAVSPALIESACSNIAGWGPPEIGMKELPFLGEILEVHMFVLRPLSCFSRGRASTRLIVPVRPPHHAFPLQGLTSPNPSSTDLRVQYKEIHTSEPVGSWARLATLLASLSELYIIFERV